MKTGLSESGGRPLTAYELGVVRRPDIYAPPTYVGDVSTSPGARVQVGASSLALSLTRIKSSRRCLPVPSLAKDGSRSLLLSLLLT